MSDRFKGTGVALVTPFKENKELDFEGLARLVKYVSDRGVDYLVVMGTTGESATLNEEEKVSILKFVIENNYKNLPIVYGLGGNNTQYILDKLRSGNFKGVDAILSVSPYYNKPSQNGIIAHYKAIADASPVPIILYNVPGRTSSNISAKSTLQLSNHPNIIGIKEASGDLIQAMEIAKGKPDDFYLISGEDLLTIPMVSFGATGVISVLANGFPEIFTAMVNNSLKGNYEGAKKYLFKLLRANPLMYEEGNPVGIKKVLEILGIFEAYVRLPLIEASGELSDKIRLVMEEEDIFEKEKA